MKTFYLNPTGNLWDRLVACWFLFWHPNEFSQGIIEHFLERVNAALARIPTEGGPAPAEVIPTVTLDTAPQNS